MCAFRTGFSERFGDITDNPQPSFGDALECFDDLIDRSRLGHRGAGCHEVTEVQIEGENNPPFLPSLL
jgi:hypothetical protein